MSDMKPIGGGAVVRLTHIRTSQGLSKAALARVAKLDQSLISKIESGRVVPYQCELDRLADALGMPRDEARSLLAPVNGGTA